MAHNEIGRGWHEAKKKSKERTLSSEGSEQKFYSRLGEHRAPDTESWETEYRVRTRRRGGS